MKKKIAIIHTGGTFVMAHNQQGKLAPAHYAEKVINQRIIPLYPAVIFEQILLLNLDSSLFLPQNWKMIAEKISDLYDEYDAFIVIHGTDTMAYTASALSFMLKNLDKAVVLTGSQLPLIATRSDAIQNLTAAVEVALYGELQEVVLVFNNTALRGNRIKKKDAWDFHAFYSPNFDPLIKLGIGMERKRHRYLPKRSGIFEIDTRVNDSVLMIPFFPGLDFSMYNPIIDENRVKGLVIEAYGSGNIPSDNPGLEELFSSASTRQIPIAVCSQSPVGKVNLDLYDVASKAEFYGLISTVDMTREATLVKLMIALARYRTIKNIKKFMTANIAGEKETSDAR